MKKNTAPTPEALLTPLQELIDHCVNAGQFMTTARPDMNRIENQFETDAERLKQGLYCNDIA
jgi:hypothetical protein